MAESRSKLSKSLEELKRFRVICLINAGGLQKNVFGAESRHGLSHFVLRVSLLKNRRAWFSRAGLWGCDEASTLDPKPETLHPTP